MVILDELTIGSNPITIRNDLPLGAQRLFTDATGIESVFCNGKEIVQQGNFTDARPEPPRVWYAYSESLS